MSIRITFIFFFSFVLERLMGTLRKENRINYIKIGNKTVYLQMTWLQIQKIQNNSHTVEIKCSKMYGSKYVKITAHIEMHLENRDVVVWRSQCVCSEELKYLLFCWACYFPPLISFLVDFLLLKTRVSYYPNYLISRTKQIQIVNNTVHCL